MGISIKNSDLIYPYFVVSGRGKKEAIESFPGVFRFSADLLIKDIGGLVSLGVNKILLFGVPAHKDASGSGAYAKENILPQAVRAIKRGFPGLIVMTDVCLCAYTSHGHCGILTGNGERVTGNVKIINSKKTLEALVKIALSHAEAGTDYVAPSAMAKRQVAAIRQALDREGYKNTKIMGYSAKFASSFYWPFRDAADCAPTFGDRRSYQLDYTDPQAALREMEDDIKEGADIVMVKPALAYLDIIKEAAGKFRKPIAAYNVSGEYVMVKKHCQSTENRAQRTESEKKLVFEVLTGIRRAGADYIITYHAKDAAKWLKEK